MNRVFSECNLRLFCFAEIMNDLIDSLSSMFSEEPMLLMLGAIHNVLKVDITHAFGRGVKLSGTA